MSLAIAIDQIQKPTWWTTETPRHGGKPISPATIAARQKILDYLETRAESGTKKVPGPEIQEYMGLTNSMMWHHLNHMLEAGTIIKHKPRHDISLIEINK